ncbi:ABC transporter permease [Chlamydia abortus]|nr:ABC transporter permease [Chlamydia abortus]SGA19495.1 ABC transporter permease [Chlamydia abortus]SGA22573.1 ABC transporter permease [Chlamydia abortus]SHD78886.1 ABC transporter permease [Chlamydia abortus]
MEAKKRARIFQILCVFPLELGRWMGFHLCSDKKLIMEEELISICKYSGL